MNSYFTERVYFCIKSEVTITTRKRTTMSERCTLLQPPPLLSAIATVVDTTTQRRAIRSPSAPKAPPQNIQTKPILFKRYAASDQTRILSTPHTAIHIPSRPILYNSAANNAPAPTNAPDSTFRPAAPAADALVDALPDALARVALPLAAEALALLALLLALLPLLAALPVELALPLPLLAPLPVAPAPAMTLVTFWPAELVPTEARMVVVLLLPRLTGTVLTPDDRPAGMVATAGWLVTTEGWVVMGRGWPVTTPRELVCVRKVVKGLE